MPGQPTHPTHEHPRWMEVGHAMGIAYLMLLIVVSLGIGQFLHKRKIYALPGCGATIIVGVLAGLLIDVLSQHHEADLLEFNAENFTLFLLPPIIFEAGYHLNMRLFRKKLAPILSLAVVGTIAATCITWYALSTDSGLLSWWVKPWEASWGVAWEGFDIVEAGQFAALISAVDPVATLAVFGALRVDHELEVVVLGESVLNDAIALIAYRAIGQYGATIHTESKAVVIAFGTIAFGSVFVGVACGALSAVVFKFLKVHHGDLPEMEAAIFFCFAYGSFVVAEVPHWSGIVASLFAGMVMRRYARPNLSVMGRAHVDTMLKTIVTFCDTLIYIYVGFALVVDVQICLTEAVPCIYIFGFVMAVGIVARAVHLYPIVGFCNLCSSKDNQISCGYQTVVWWGGLRGAIAVALAVQLQGRHASLIRAVTMLVVVTTTFVLGGSTKCVLDTFKVPTGVEDDHGEEAERHDASTLSVCSAEFYDNLAADAFLDEELNPRTVYRPAEWPARTGMYSDREMQGGEPPLLPKGHQPSDGLQPKDHSSSSPEGRQALSKRTPPGRHATMKALVAKGNES